MREMYFTTKTLICQLSQTRRFGPIVSKKCIQLRKSINILIKEPVGVFCCMQQSSPLANIFTTILFKKKNNILRVLTRLNDLYDFLQCDSARGDFSGNTIFCPITTNNTD